MKKQELFKTAKYENEYVAILRAYHNDKLDHWSYTIQKINGDVEARIPEEELSNFVL